MTASVQVQSTPDNDLVSVIMGIIFRRVQLVSVMIVKYSCFEKGCWKKSAKVHAIIPKINLGYDQ